MKGYEEAHAGSADRILKVFENEQRHRHKMENSLRRSGTVLLHFQEIVPLLLATFFVCACLWLIFTGQVDIFGYGLGVFGGLLVTAKVIQYLRREIIRFRNTLRKPPEE